MRQKQTRQRRQKLLPETLVTRLLDATTGARFEHRDRAMLELLYATGMRVGELIKLNVKDVDLETGSIKVMGKGKKPRTVLFGESAKRALRAHLSEKRTGPLFQNIHGIRMRARLVRHTIDKYAKKANLGVKVSPHSLRHSMASHMLARGANPFIVKELLGHAMLRTTAIYLHAIDTGMSVEDAYRAFHPHA